MPRSRTTPLLLLLGIILVAANLRPVIAGFGPLLAQIQADLGVSAATISLLTSIPLLCWGFFALITPLFLRTRSAEVIILISLALIGTGASLRAGPNLPWILFGTVLVGIGIAVINVLLPGLIRRDFPERLGLVTGIYTTAVVGGAALASAVSVPLQNAFAGSWRMALGIWALLALVGALAWWPAVRGRPARHGLQAALGSIWSNPATLPVTLFMGLQSLMFYIWLTWLPNILIERSVPGLEAGFLLSLSNLVQLPFSLFIPVLASRLPSTRPLILGIFVCLVLGVGGLLYLPAVPPIWWVLLFGIGTGSAFPLALYFIAHRARSAAETPQLSAIAQGLGYLLAAAGPLLFGAAHDLSHTWTLPLTLLLAASVLVLLSGWWAAGK